ncbi:MAG: hypothetical protein AB1571_00245 [Nanoarchaeota archaeon]
MDKCKELINLVGIINSSKELYKLAEEVNSDNIRIVLPYCCKNIYLNDGGRSRTLINYNPEKRFFAIITTYKIDDSKMKINIISNDKNFINTDKTKRKLFEDPCFREVLKEYLNKIILENFEVEDGYRCN